MPKNQFGRTKYGSLNKRNICLNDMKNYSNTQPRRGAAAVLST